MASWRSRRSGRRRSRRSRRNRGNRNSWRSGNRSFNQGFNRGSSLQPLWHSIPPPVESTSPPVRSYQQPPNIPQSSSLPAGSSSVLSNVLSRVTELWRRDEKALSDKLDAAEGAEAGKRKDVPAVLAEVRNPEDFTITEPTVTTHKFQCQLAHGSPTALISGFNNPTELYQKIADSYDDITFDQILFCTRNTHRIDMDSVLSGSLMTTDFIFAHIRGQKKEVELVKEMPLLGITLSDNWAGRVFVRKISPDLQLGKSGGPAVEVGDHIEQINGESMVGKRHYYAAARLRQIPVGAKFTIRLVSPLKSGFSFIGPRSGAASKKFAAPMAAAMGGGLMDGAQTIRFKSDGKAVIEEPSSKVIIDRLNDIFDNYLGFNDDELANTVLDIGRECQTLAQMEERVKHSTLQDFDFSTDFLLDLWTTVDDWKKNRLGEKSSLAVPAKVVEAEAKNDSDSFDDDGEIKDEKQEEEAEEEDNFLDAESGGNADDDDIWDLSGYRSSANTEKKELMTDGDDGDDELAAAEDDREEEKEVAEVDESFSGAELPPPPPLPSVFRPPNNSMSSSLPTARLPWLAAAQNKKKENSRVWGMVRMLDDVD